MVGAGVSGLVAARVLSDTGLDVALFEAGDDIGGAAGAGWFWSAGSGAWDDYLRACGLRDDAVVPAWGFGLGWGGRLYALASMGAEARGPFRLPFRRARIERVARHWEGLDLAFAERAERFDDRSVHDFAALYFGRGVAETWFEPWLACRAPVAARTTSRLALLLAWARRDDPTLALRDAPSRLEPRWVGAAELRCGARVNGIHATATGFRIEAEGDAPRDTRAILLAAGGACAGLAAGVWTSEQCGAVAALESAPTLQWRAPLREWPAAIASRSEASASALATPAARTPAWIRLTKAQSPWIRAIAFDAGGAELRADLRDGSRGAPLEAAALAVHLQVLVPGLRVDAEASHLVRARRAVFPVGRYRAIARARRRVARTAGLFVAGERWAEASVEGAAASGTRAAREMIAFLEIPAK